MKLSIARVGILVGLLIVLGACEGNDETFVLPTRALFPSETPQIAETPEIAETPPQDTGANQGQNEAEAEATLTPTEEVTATETASDTPQPSATPSIEPSQTPSPTDTPQPSATPTATATLEPSQTPQPSATATPEGLSLRVTALNLNIRNGPGDSYDVVAHLEQDAVLPVVGVSDGGTWLQVEYEAGLNGWVFSGFVALSGEIASAPNTQPTPLPELVRLEGVTHFWQAFNNCAPTALTMGLSYYLDTEGRVTPEFTATLEEATAYLRPTSNRDVSVDISEMVDFVNERFPGVRSVWRSGGRWTSIRQLVAAGFPVIIETGVQVNNPPAGQPGGWAGHNRLIIGYDGDVILTFDSFLGHGNYQGYRIPQAELDALWREQNRQFMVLYEIEREAEVAYLLGEDWQRAANLENTRRRAEAEIAAANPGEPPDFFALYNLGETYAALGEYAEAAAAYDEALKLETPFRVFWYQFGFFEAYYYTGRYAQVRWFANNALENMGGNGAEELYFWRGMGLAGQGNLEGARQDFRRAIEFNPRFRPAQQALDEVERGTFKPPI